MASAPASGGDEAIAVLADVTRLKSQQAQLETLARDRESMARRTRAILDSVLVGIVIVGPAGIEWMNRSAQRMFGAELSEFLDAPIETVATAEADHPFRSNRYLDELIEGEAATFECRVRARDGREFWVVGNAVATGRDDGGSRQLTYALLDIERRRQAEAAVSQAQDSLRRVIGAAPLAIALLDARTLRFVQLNEVAARVVGETPERLIGKTPEEMFGVAVGAERRRDMESALRSPEVTTREYRIERDGELQVWDARYLPLSAGPGEPADQLLLVATDVTEQRAAQEARLEAAIAQRDMLVKEVHHRIKNNLQGVAGLLQQIAKRKPEVAGPIDEVVGQVQAIAQVYGLQVGESGPLSMVRVLEAITTSVRRTFGRTIHCRVDGPGVADWILPEGEAIPVALTLNELLTNAIKHTPEVAGAEGDEGAVDCALEGDADGVRIAVRNRAQLPPGFSLGRIPNGVSGLGLVRALLPRRSATLQHRAGRPACRRDRRLARAGRDPRRRRIRSGPAHDRRRRRRSVGNKGTILVVDDNRLVLATLTDGLSQAGYRVIDADNGDDAILLAREHKPDLALLDIRMEGKSGFDVAQYLRTQCRMPFMFLSAFSDEETVAQVEALGAVAYLVKPLDIRQIVPAVEAAFAHLEAGRSEARSGHAQPHRGTASNDPLPAVVAMAAGVLMHRHSLKRDEALERLGRLAAADGWSLAEQSELLLAAVERLAEFLSPGALRNQARRSESSRRGPARPRRGSSPPWRRTMRRTVARPMPVPGNSLALCRRWKAPNRRSA